MSVSGDDGVAPDSVGAKHRWGSRETDRSAHDDPGSTRTPGERITARIGFARFERVCVTFTASAVLIGCGIMVFAAFDNPNPAGDAAIEPGIIVAQPEKPVEAQDQPDSAAAQTAATAPLPHPAPIAPNLSMLSQTPIRESAREALARNAVPVPKARAAAEAPPPDDALGYADAVEKASEPAEPASQAAMNDPRGVVADEAGRPTNCFVKVGGRVLSRGGCKVSRRGSAVVLAYGGSTVTISPGRGREWTLSVGGRAVGKVYKSGGACWGSRNHTWVCEKGA